MQGNVALRAVKEGLTSLAKYMQFYSTFAGSPGWPDPNAETPGGAWARPGIS
jgi:hypothetical protein